MFFMPKKDQMAPELDENAKKCIRNIYTEYNQNCSGRQKCGYGYVSVCKCVCVTSYPKVCCGASKEKKIKQLAKKAK